MLTPKQEKLLEIGGKKGFITIRDAYHIYNSKESRRNALRQLEELGYIQKSKYPNIFTLK